jgi:hypothetical protein
MHKRIQQEITSSARTDALRQRGMLDMLALMRTPITRHRRRLRYPVPVAV